MCKYTCDNSLWVSRSRVPYLLSMHARSLDKTHTNANINKELLIIFNGDSERVEAVLRFDVKNWNFITITIRERNIISRDEYITDRNRARNYNSRIRYATSRNLILLEQFPWLQRAHRTADLPYISSHPRARGEVGREILLPLLIPV